MRYQASLASLIEYRFISPGGKAGGAPILARGSNANGFARWPGDRSADRAKSPLVMIDRPSDRPVASTSDQATV